MGLIIATLGLALAGRLLGTASWPVRAAGIAAAGAVAAAAFVAVEPRCLAGPFAMMDPTVRALWFNNVSEMQSLWAVALKSPPAGAAIAAFPAVGLLALALIARDPATRRDFGFLVAAAALVIATAVMCSMVRAFSYAIWLAIPMVAAGVVSLFPPLRSGTLAARTLIALFLTPAVTAAVAMAAVQAVTARAPEPENSRVALGCLLDKSYETLAALPPGLVATDIDYGPFVLALTPHAVMSAPYHRLVGPIIAAHEIFALPPDAARKVVDAAKPDYLAVCGRHTLGHIGEAERGASLWGRLAARRRPALARARRGDPRRAVRGLPRQAVTRLVWGLLVLPISTDPALRPNGRLLYDAVNPPGWRARMFLGIGPGAILGRCDHLPCASTGCRMGPADLLTEKDFTNGQGHRDRPRHDQFVRRRDGRQNSQGHRELGRA